MDCRLPRKNNKNHEANVVDNIIQDVSNINLSPMVSKVNLVGSNPKNDGLRLVPLDMCAQTKSCSLLLNHSMGRKFS